MTEALGLGLIVKLASLVIHVQELDAGAPSAAYDIISAKAIANDPAVLAWIATIDPALLPLKR